MTFIDHRDSLTSKITQLGHSHLRSFIETRQFHRTFQQFISIKIFIRSFIRIPFIFNTCAHIVHHRRKVRKVRRGKSGIPKR